MQMENLVWMRETSTRLYMQMELLSCMDELDWVMQDQHCAVNNYPKEYWPSLPLSAPPNCYNTAKTCVRGGRWLQRVFSRRLFG